MNIVILTGSISTQSNNKKIARWFERQYQDRVNITQFPLKSIPFYDQDCENDPPQEICEMRDLLSTTDGLVLITPEYNHSIPGVLKNVLDWASRGVHVLEDMPIYIVGGSTGRFGTLRSQIHLIQILNSPGISARIFPTQIQIDHVDEKFTLEGDCNDPQTEKYLRRGMESFLESLR